MIRSPRSLAGLCATAVLAAGLASLVVPARLFAQCRPLDIEQSKHTLMLLEHDQFVPRGIDVLPNGDVILRGRWRVTDQGSNFNANALAYCNLGGPLTHADPNLTRRAGSTTGVSLPALNLPSPGRSAVGPIAAVPPFDAVVAVGYADRGLFSLYHAYRWTEATGLLDLGTLDPANDANRSSQANAVSRDGTVVVGFSETAIPNLWHAFRWTSAGGMVDLGAPAGVARNSNALAVSADGNVVVGEAESADTAHFAGIRWGAFRWTASGGFQSLGSLETAFFTRANATSADGSVVVGEGGVSLQLSNTFTNASRAVRWTTAGSIQAIGPLAGHRFAHATAVSDDGRIVVGVSTPDVGQPAAFRWTEATGLQDLRQTLVSAGLDLTGVQLVAATGISRDGQWITGEAITTASGNERIGFVAKYCDDVVGAACTTLDDEPVVTPTFELTVSGGTTRTVAAGQSATATLTVTPSGGFAQPVTFACSGLPAGATCAFTPPSVTPSSGAATSTLTISTRSSALAPPVAPPRGWSLLAYRDPARPETRNGSPGA